MDLIPVNQYIDSGIWIIRIIPEVSVADGIVKVISGSGFKNPVKVLID